MGILLKNGLIITQNGNRDILEADLLIEGNIIKRISPDIEPEQHHIYDFTGLVISPGFIQSHIHLCQTLFRNLADDMELLDWLEKRIWPMEMAHNEESLRASAQLGLAEIMLGGVTSILDMGNGKFQEVIFEELAASGIRGFSGMVMMDTGDQPYKQDTAEVLNETEKYIEKWNGYDNGRIGYALAPRFVPSCSKKLWAEVKELAEKSGLIIHTHASENNKEWQLVKNSTGHSNVEFFVRRGLASSKLCLAHCIWVSDDEIKMLHDYSINVLHCPTANLKLGSGIAPIPKFLARKINVSLGSDGAPCNNNLDIFQEMRLASLIQKPLSGVTSTSAAQIFDMATINGAKSLGLESQIGSLEEGKKADLIVLNLNKVHSIPADDIYAQIVYSAWPTDVRHVMIDGKWVVFDQILKNHSLDKIKEDTWKEIQNLFQRQ
jgi:5-methylthioadenosine/S-adenosylhomocysteine deaminase